MAKVVLLRHITMPRLLFVVISIFVNVPTHAQTSGPTPPPARVVFTKIDTISGPFCAGEARGMHAWPSSEAFDLSLSEYSLKVTPNAGTSGYTVQTAGSSGCDKTYSQETLEHGYFSSICSNWECDYNFSLSVGYVDAKPDEVYCYGKCLVQEIVKHRRRMSPHPQHFFSSALIPKTCGQCTDSDLVSSSACASTMAGFVCNGCVVTNPTPQCETCLPFSSASCPGTTGGWNNQDCQGSNSQYYCCCGGEGYYCRDEADCPSPAPVPSPEPTPPPTFPTPGSKIACHGAPTTPFPTPTPIPTPFSTPTPTPTPPMLATTCGPCEGYCFIENKDQCITCSSDGAGSHATSKICNQQHGIRCTTCECPSPTTPAPAPALPSGTFTYDCTSRTTSCSKQTIAFGTGLQWDVSEPVTMTTEIDQCTTTFHYDAEAVEPDQVTLTENSACSISGPSTCSCYDAGVTLMTFSLSGDGTALSLTGQFNGVRATTLWGKHAENGGGSSFSFIYVGAAVAGVVVAILILASVWWFRSRKVEIEGVDSAPLVENDQMNIESSAPYHEFSGDETTC